MDTQEILNQRGKQYGDYVMISHVMQSICCLLITDNMTSVEKTAIQMIAMKLARIKHDPTYKDNWQDIAGYAELVVNEIERVEAQIENHELNSPTYYAGEL